MKMELQVRLDWCDILYTVEKARYLIGECLVNETKGIKRLDLLCTYEALACTLEELRRGERQSVGQD